MACCCSGRRAPGKTLLARAVAGEAHAAFFSIAASEFIEAIVGVGAARVRDLFAKAKEAAPAIIFIDELDAIGRSRQGSAADHRRQRRARADARSDPDRDGRLRAAEAVVVLGATNRPEILDPALLRPGRFDRRVAVQPPDRTGRLKILEVHTRSIPLADDVDLASLASTTPGMVGADLANLGNEAALLAARRDHEKVQMADFTDSLEKILLGAPRGIVLSTRGPRADRLPRVRARAGRDAHPRRRPGAQGLDHPARPGARSDPVDARCRPRCPTRARTSTRRSRSRSAAASPRRSSTARSPPAPSQTSSS